MHARSPLPLLVPVLVLLAQGCRSTEPAPRMYAGFGSYHREVTTSSPEAQRWFDQAIQLTYGFNHGEALRSYREAARLDPDCGMAWWGIAYANGLDINNQEITEEEDREAWEAAQQAIRCLPRVSPAEAALIRAVAERCAWPPPADRSGFEQAYAAAMESAWREHPDDPDIGTLYAEALMNLQPWDLWTREGKPKGRTEELVAALEAVVAQRPDHPGANHFYIHAVEASPDAARGVAAADRLTDLVPGSGHLVHMPSHIYVRVGRYADASDANERAVAADRAYFALAPDPGFYSLYYCHNVHMLAFAAMMEGRRELALSAASDLDRDVPRDFLRQYAGLADGLMATPLHVMIRFGLWEQILQAPAPARFQKMSIASRHYARGVALSALGRTAEARAELEDFEAAAAAVPEDWTVGTNKASEILSLERQMLRGELLYREGRHEEAFTELREGVRLEDELVYDEPPGWMQPVRHALGALLMGAGRPAEAEQVYREDLLRHPGNGWSLLGLEQALRVQDRTQEADATAELLARAWPRADVQPSSSCYCQPGRALARGGS